ncbi:uncharacterized protein LOC125807259 [Solanum verrucosum]|uniref:uncharacterized protein LOC125807259 n=1 Tax=Solanum verrucosum TaxID=315347 RepID=UPI0020CFF124|nr:uncharacterized protein LOC125807259 [Solanum verrucosum]
MAAPANMEEGQSSTRPPRFNGQCYGWWKNRMHDYINAKDTELWDVILDGPYIPTKDVKYGELTTIVIKTKKEYNETDKKKIEKNYKAKNILVCGIGKANAITEAKDLKTLAMDELIGNFQTYELNKQQGTNMKEGKKEKSVALKTSQNDVTEEDDEMTYVTRRFQKIIKKHEGFRPVEQQMQMIFVINVANLVLDHAKRKSHADQLVKKALDVWGNASRESEEETNIPEDVLMMAVEDDKTVYNSIFSLIEKSDDEEDLNEKRGSSQCWYMDSGCSRHMTEDTLNFFFLEAHQGGGVSFGSGKKGSILGIGKIGRIVDHSIDKLHYVDGLKYNLLSVSQICDKGNEVKFMSNRCLVTNFATKRVVMSAKRVQNMDMVRGLPKLKFSNDKVCDACTKGKEIRSSFKAKKGVSTTRPLELLHMDLCGPIRIQSRGGKKYILVVVDDFSRFTWNMFLRTKDEMVGLLITFDKAIQLKVKCKIASIRSDHGTEFENSKIEGFYAKNGINHNFSAPRTPQQNGVVERKNRTLVDIARTMLIDLGHGMNFWAEAVNTACYVTNRCVIRSDEGVFVGYSSTSKAYRVFNKRTLCVEEKMHVIFDEFEKNDEHKEEHELEELIKRKQDKAIQNLGNKQVAKENGATHTREPSPSGSAQEVLSQNPEDDEAFISSIDPNNIKEALQDSDWGYNQEEEIDYDETFALVARMEAIRILIAFAAHVEFKLFQMDVKSAFLNGNLKEKVYVKKPPYFEDADLPNHVLKLDKALYGLKQAPRAWYEHLSKFLLANGFKKGKIDNTLFLKSRGKEFLIMRVYVDDIIFGATSDSLCKKFADEKYIKELLKKFNLLEAKVLDTPMSTSVKLDLDGDGIEVNQTMYRGIIGSLMYLTTSRPDIVFSVGMCVRFQAAPKESHLKAAKRVLRYLKVYLLIERAH